MGPRSCGRRAAGPTVATGRPTPLGLRLGPDDRVLTQPAHFCAYAAGGTCLSPFDSSSPVHCSPTTRRRMIMTVLTQEPLALARRGVALYGDVEQRAVAVLRRVAPTLLRISLGVVFVWFGALKVANLTPVGDLVAGTLPFVDPVWFVPVLGGVEVALGLGLLLGRAITVVSAVLVAHLCGTFLVLVMQPESGLPERQPAAAHHHRGVRGQERGADLRGPGPRGPAPGEQDHRLTDRPTADRQGAPSPGRPDCRPDPYGIVGPCDFPTVSSGARRPRPTRSRAATSTTTGGRPSTRPTPTASRSAATPATATTGTARTSRSWPGSGCPAIASAWSGAGSSRRTGSSPGRPATTTAG